MSSIPPNINVGLSPAPNTSVAAPQPESFQFDLGNEGFLRELKSVVMGFTDGIDLVHLGRTSTLMLSILRKERKREYDGFFLRRTQVLLIGSSFKDKLDFYTILIERYPDVDRLRLLIAEMKSVFQQMVTDNENNLGYIIKAGIKIAEVQHQIDPPLAAHTLREVLHYQKVCFVNLDDSMDLLQAAAKWAPEAIDELEKSAFETVIKTEFFFLNDETLIELVLFYLAQNNIDKATEVMGKIEEPFYQFIAQTYLQLKYADHDQKRIILEEARGEVSLSFPEKLPEGLFYIAKAQAAMGDRKRAKESLTQFNEFASISYVTIDLRVKVYLLQREFDKEWSIQTLLTMIGSPTLRHARDKIEFFEKIFTTLLDSEKKLVISAFKELILSSDDENLILGTLALTKASATTDVAEAKIYASSFEPHSAEYNQAYYAIFMEELKTDREGAYQTANLLPPIARPLVQFMIASMSPTTSDQKKA